MLASAICCPCVDCVAIAIGVLAIIWVGCAAAMLAMLTIGVACICTGAIETALSTCCSIEKINNRRRYIKHVFVCVCGGGKPILAPAK